MDLNGKCEGPRTSPAAPLAPLNPLPYPDTANRPFPCILLPENLHRSVGNVSDQKRRPQQSPPGSSVLRNKFDIHDAQLLADVEALYTDHPVAGFSFAAPPHANRELPLTFAAATALKAHKKRQAAHRLSCGLKYHSELDLVFPQQNGSPQDPANASRDWGNIKRELGLPEKLHFHDLRHTYASTLEEMDVSVKKFSYSRGMLLLPLPWTPTSTKPKQ